MKFRAVEVYLDLIYGTVQLINIFCHVDRGQHIADNEFVIFTEALHKL